MKRTIAILAVLALTLSMIGCAAQSEPAKPAPASAPAATSRAAAAGNPLSKVTVGMTKGQVREVAGQPSDENSYATGKVWIPFYFGNDARRTSWYYKGQGRVVFADGNVFGGGTASVMRVDIDPTESGVAR
jgi:hypothetical protein